MERYKAKGCLGVAQKLIYMYNIEDLNLCNIDMYDIENILSDAIKA